MTTVIHDGPHLQREYRVRQEELSTLQGLSEKVLALEETKFDYVVDTRRMSFSTVHRTREEADAGATGEGGSYLTFDTDDHDSVTGGIVNEHAHRQIRERLGIPARYYDRMREESPGLLDTNVGHWLREKPETRMVRMLEGKVRAFLSNRYRRLDNIDLLQQAILPELAKYENDLVFHLAALTDERLYVRALLPGLQGEVKVGDIVQAGVQISNSEVGSGALSVQPFLWRLSCLNGMVANVGNLRRYHVGREQEESALAMYRDDTLAADDRAFFLKVRDSVGAALDETMFFALVEQLQEATEGARIDDPVKATEKLGKAHNLTDGEESGMLRFLATGGDLTQWGTANAVTAMAKGADTFARQEELETLGGVLATLPATDWAAIAR